MSHPFLGPALAILGRLVAFDTRSSETNLTMLDNVQHLLQAQGVEAILTFGAEGGRFQTIGVPAVVCGPGHIEQAHKADEYVALAQRSDCLQFLDSLAMTFNHLPPR